ncbi:Asp/Glu/Hydantoin racemase-domain-containing protein [Trichophaea hybrida]|nr:Asp/Glu/Hydantoin racemase-domain-containing protein [Trichophaea hybrida]
MTTALAPVIAPLLPPTSSSLPPLLLPLLTPPKVTAIYFTGPPSSPPSINGLHTSDLSARECLPLLKPLLPNHDGFLVACYSAHPLIPALRALTKKPVIGIMEASIYHSLSLLSPQGKVGVVTTGKAWEALLTEGLGGVESTGLDADQLHKAGEGEVKRRMKEAVGRLLEGKGVEVVALGCAGMVGLEECVKEVGEEVRVVDGVQAGVGVLVGMLGRGYED